jgi:pimeloyl-ACP methyl ester carboxylesterase
MPFADVNGQRIRFDDSGGTGSPVILSHGFLMDREMFAPQVDALAPEFRVLTWDERGFGETEFDGQPFTYWDSARDCLGLLDHLGIDQCVLGGMSQGGWIAKWQELPRESMRATGDCLMGRDDITDRVGEISCPAIVFHGTADQSIELEKAEQLSQALSGSAGVVRVDGAPHAANLTHPTAVNEPLLHFLRAL